MRRPRILIICNQQWPRALLRAQLLEEGYNVSGALSVAAALSAPPPGPWDVVLRRPVTIGETVEAVKQIAPIHESCPASEA